VKILWHSNAPWVGTGYGQQTRLFATLLQAQGHEVLVSAGYGHRHGVFSLDGIKVLPSGMDPIGIGLLSAHWAKHKPDVCVLLGDSWPLEADLLRRMPLALWAPVDQQPLPPPVAQKLGVARWVFAMSRFGEAGMRTITSSPRSTS
jgi:hypothetical protein